MLTLHYYSNAKGVRATLTRVTTGWWSEDDDPVYSKHLIKEFEVENPPLEDELAWILKKGISIFRHLSHFFFKKSSIRFWERERFINTENFILCVNNYAIDCLKLKIERKIIDKNFCNLNLHFCNKYILHYIYYI